MATLENARPVSQVPLAIMLVFPVIAYGVGFLAMPRPASVQLAREAIDRTTLEGDVVLKAMPNPQVVANANFGNQLTVLGLDAEKTRVSPGTRLPLTFYFRCDTEMQEEWKVFLHVDAQSAQYRIHGDHFPPAGFSTDKWRKGDIIADRYALWVPLDAQKGNYDIWMGFYDPNHSDDRLQLVADQAHITTDSSNRVKLGTLVVE
jgi:hypothetical protein